MEAGFFYFLGALSVVAIWLFSSGLGDLKKSRATAKRKEAVELATLADATHAAVDDEDSQGYAISLGNVAAEVKDNPEFKSSSQALLLQTSSTPSAPPIIASDRGLFFQNLSFLVIGGIVGLAALTFLLTASPSKDYTATAEAACVNWFKHSEVGGFDSFASSVWEKDRKVVVEIGFNKTGQEYSTRLCVYDPETGDMSAPNNLTRSRWE